MVCHFLLSRVECCKSTTTGFGEVRHLPAVILNGPHP
jgi:hypothetical protein